MPAEQQPWRPSLANSIMLRYDRVRGAELLLMPERVVVLNDEAGRVLRLCDGTRDTAEIVAELTELFPGAPVAKDVPEFLARVRTEGWLRWPRRSRASRSPGRARCRPPGRCWPR